jgi:hypothetical protein
LFEDLTGACDACGKPVSGGFHKCPKCKIYLCFFCGLQSISKSVKFSFECPRFGLPRGFLILKSSIEYVHFVLVGLLGAGIIERNRKDK